MGLYVIWLHLTLLSNLGAVWNSLQLEKKGGYLKLHVLSVFQMPFLNVIYCLYQPHDTFPTVQIWV